ncbi:MAG: translation initiation factor IF-2 N-terminal domain-containing protein [Planctomycetaceae bacterium]
MKIRIFALARDLGLDSKVLIDLCEQAGVKLRNALATISEEERDTVVAYIRSKGTTTAGSTPPVEMTPVRDIPLVAGKVRQIVGIPSRTSGRIQDEIEDQVDELENIEIAEVDVSENHAAVEAVTVEETPVSAVEAQIEDTAEAEAVAIVPAETSEVLPTPADEALPKAESVPADAMRRPKMARQREMRPIGSVKDREQQAAGAAAKPAGPIKVNRDRERQPGRPMVAAAPTLRLRA